MAEYQLVVGVERHFDAELEEEISVYCAGLRPDINEDLAEAIEQTVGGAQVDELGESSEIIFPEGTDTDAALHLVSRVLRNAGHQISRIHDETVSLHDERDVFQHLI